MRRGWSLQGTLKVKPDGAVETPPPPHMILYCCLKITAVTYFTSQGELLYLVTLLRVTYDIYGLPLVTENIACNCHVLPFVFLFSTISQQITDHFLIIWQIKQSNLPGSPSLNVANFLLTRRVNLWPGVDSPPVVKGICLYLRIFSICGVNFLRRSDISLVHLFHPRQVVIRTFSSLSQFLQYRPILGIKLPNRGNAE